MVQRKKKNISQNILIFHYKGQIIKIKKTKGNKYVYLNQIRRELLNQSLLYGYTNKIIVYFAPSTTDL